MSQRGKIVAAVSAGATGLFAAAALLIAGTPASAPAPSPTAPPARVVSVTDDRHAVLAPNLSTEAAGSSIVRLTRVEHISPRASSAT